jgi:hypothetical protein
VGGCAGPAIFARALNLPKHVDVILIIVFLSDFAMRTPENTMPAKKAPRIPLPKAWTRQVRSAMLHLISLAQYVTVYTRSWAVDSMNGRVRLKAEYDRLRREIGLLREEIRIKDARMVQPFRNAICYCVLDTECRAYA